MKYESSENDLEPGARSAPWSCAVSGDHRIRELLAVCVRFELALFAEAGAFVLRQRPDSLIAPPTLDEIVNTIYEHGDAKCPQCVGAMAFRYDDAARMFMARCTQCSYTDADPTARTSRH